MRSGNLKKIYWYTESSKFLSQDQLRNHSNNSCAEIAPDGENTTVVQPAFHGLVLDQKNIDPKESFIGAQKNLHDILTGTSDGNFLRRTKNRSTNHSTRTSQQQPDIENRDLTTGTNGSATGASTGRQLLSHNQNSRMINIQITDFRWKDRQVRRTVQQKPQDVPTPH